MILSGLTVRDILKDKLISKISTFSSVPELAIIQIGDNLESDTYINQKKKFGQSIKIPVHHFKFEESDSEGKIISQIEKLNDLNKIGGIIVQLPIPKNLNRQKILNSISPEKDVDGLGFLQKGKLLSADPGAILPATSRGILSLLDYYKISISGKHVVVIGRSELVGKPTALSLLNLDATITLCHSKTKDLKDITKMADILIVAIGSPKFIGPEYVKEGQTVIDVGICKTQDGFVGDTQFENIKDIVENITPVPGGVGPLTVVSLFENLVDNYIQ